MRGHPAQIYTHMHTIRPKCSSILCDCFFVASVTLILKIYCLLPVHYNRKSHSRLKKCAFSTVLHYTKLSPRVASSLENCSSSSNEEKSENFLAQSRAYRDRARSVTIYLYVDFMSVLYLLN